MSNLNGMRVVNEISQDSLIVSMTFDHSELRRTTYELFSDTPKILSVIFAIGADIIWRSYDPTSLQLTKGQTIALRNLSDMMGKIKEEINGHNEFEPDFLSKEDLILRRFVYRNPWMDLEALGLELISIRKGSVTGSVFVDSILGLTVMIHGWRALIWGAGAIIRNVSEMLDDAQCRRFRDILMQKFLEDGTPVAKQNEVLQALIQAYRLPIAPKDEPSEDLLGTLARLVTKTIGTPSKIDPS
jgi:hypothetical protein